MQNRYVITFIGDDRRGIVEHLADKIQSHDGNWLDSRLSQLEGKFAGLILVELSDARSAALEQALGELPGGDLSVRVTPAGEAPDETGLPLALNLMGPDRPGIVREISSALAAAGLNVLTMDSHVESAAFTGEPIFYATISAIAAETLSIAALKDKLDAIAETMTVEIDIDIDS